MKTQTKKIDGDSVKNQKIKGKFVAREVLTCFSYEMDAILKASAEGRTDLPTYDDIENMYEYRCPECGDGFQSVDHFKYNDSNYSDKKYCCSSCGESFDDQPESEPQEVFEWWIVTEFLYNKLKKKGQVVLEWGNNCYWGRCTTGQAILLDGVITSICRDMEILDDQENSWAENV